MGITNHIKRATARAVQTALVFFVVLVIAACSHKAMSVMFDLPPPEPGVEDTEVVLEESSRSPDAGSVVTAYWEDPQAERPPIEVATSWEQALELLPRDAKGNADWSAAVRDGIVRPRALLLEDLGAKAFQLDFFMRAKKEKFDAWFPHSAHTEWLGCRNCHGTIFKYASNEMSMKEMRKGEYCGACHDEIAFDLKQCDRCHLAMKK